MTEGPYKLPKGWRWVRLEDITRVFSGSSAPQDEDYFTEGKYPFVRVSDLSSSVDGYITKTRDAVNDKAIKELKLIKAAAGTIVFPKSGAAILTNARAILAIDAYIVSHLAALSPDRSKADKDWLYYYLSTVDMGQYSDNPSYPSLKLARIKNILIPLPPLSEQKRIVARINDLFSRIREAKRLRQEAQQEAERLWQSVLADTFPKPGTKLPNGWQWVKLGEVFEFQQGAAMSPKRRQRRNPKPFLRTRNIFWGYVDVNSVDEMDFTDEEVEKLRLQPGDLLVCEGGDVGKTAIWEGNLPIMLYQNHIHRLRAKDSSAEPRFVMYWMQAAYKVFIAYQGAESRTAIPNLSGRRLKEFLIPLCILSEQKKIVTYLEAVQEKIKTLRQSQSQVNSEIQLLENTILEKAFRGDL
jgi:type I restriction enzyme S subunit